MALLFIGLIVIIFKFKQMKQVGTYQRKKSYFTKSQATLPVVHPRQQFLSIIKAKKEYQSLIKRQLEALEIYENEEKAEVSKYEKQLQTKDAFIRPFMAQQPIKEEKSQEQFRMCFKQLQHTKITKQFQRFMNKMKVFQEIRRNIMGAKYFYEDHQRKKCMQIWVGQWKRSKLERRQRLRVQRERERQQIEKKAQIQRKQQEEARKIKQQQIKQQQQKLKAILNEKAVNLQKVQRQLKSEHERLNEEKRKAQFLIQQMQRKKNEFVKWQQEIAAKQQTFIKKQQQIHLKLVSNVLLASELRLNSQIADISKPQIQQQHKNTLIKPVQVQRPAKKQKNDEDFRVCSKQLQSIKRQREFMKFISKIKMVKRGKQMIDSSKSFYRNNLMGKYMGKWVEAWQKAKRQIQQQKRLQKERYLKQMELKMQNLLRKQESTRRQDEKAKTMLEERAKDLQKVSLQLKNNNERLSQEMRKTFLMMQQMERKRADLAKQQEEIAKKQQIMNRKQAQISQKLSLNQLIKDSQSQKKVDISYFRKPQQVKNSESTRTVIEQPNKQERGQEDLIICYEQLRNIKIKTQFQKLVRNIRTLKEFQTKNTEATNLISKNLKRRYVFAWADASRRSKAQRQQKLRVQMERERAQIQEKIEIAKGQQEQRRKIEQERIRLQEQQKKYEEEHIRAKLDEKAKNLQQFELQLMSGNQRLADERKKTQYLVQQMERKQEQLAKRQYELAIQQQLLNKNSAFRFFQIDPSFLHNSPSSSKKSNNQQQRVFSSSANKRMPHFPQQENIFQIYSISPQKSNQEDNDGQFGFSAQKGSTQSIYGRSHHKPEGQIANLQQLLEYQDAQQQCSDQPEQRKIEQFPFEQRSIQQKEGSISQQPDDQIQNYVQDKYNWTLKRKAFKGLIQNNQYNYDHNLRAKCFNGLKIYYCQKKTLRKYLQLQQQASTQAYSYYPSTFQQKLQFQQLKNG